MDWNYWGGLAVSVLIFAPGLIFLAIYVLVWPLAAVAPEREREPETEAARARQVPARSSSVRSGPG